LTQIVVDEALKEKAHHYLYHGVPKEAPPPPKAAANGSSKYSDQITTALSVST
jgi:hypothetical protein